MGTSYTIHHYSKTEATKVFHANTKREAWAVAQEIARAGGVKYITIFGTTYGRRYEAFHTSPNQTSWNLLSRDNGYKSI